MLIFAFWMPIFPVSERFDEALDPPKLVTGLLLIDSLLEGNFNFLEFILFPTLKIGLSVRFWYFFNGVSEHGTGHHSVVLHEKFFF